MEIKNVSLDEENVLSTRIGEQIKNALGTRYSDLSKFTYKTWYWWWCYSSSETDASCCCCVVVLLRCCGVVVLWCCGVV